MHVWTDLLVHLALVKIETCKYILHKVALSRVGEGGGKGEEINRFKSLSERRVAIEKGFRLFRQLGCLSSKHWIIPWRLALVSIINVFLSLPLSPFAIWYR